jgi:phosphoribosylanthranilate isomerase
LSHTRIKFCGLTRSEDVDAAVELGADAIGFVMVPGSKRELDLQQAALLRARVPVTVKTVLLFQNASADRVRETIAILKPDLLQFHGSESPEFCEGFGLSYLIAVAMGDGNTDVVAEASRHPKAAGVLLDSHLQGGMGGQGIRFDWSKIPRTIRRPLVLAGGLNPANVGEAVSRVGSYAVDVSSGIESAPGIKDYAKMQAFIEEVRRVERG